LKTCPPPEVFSRHANRVVECHLSLFRMHWDHEPSRIRRLVSREAFWGAAAQAHGYRLPVAPRPRPEGMRIRCRQPWRTPEPSESGHRPTEGWGQGNWTHPISTKSGGLGLFSAAPPGHWNGLDRLESYWHLSPSPAGFCGVPPPRTVAVRAGRPAISEVRQLNCSFSRLWLALILSLPYRDHKGMVERDRLTQRTRRAPK
jgi:hypothetical protein